MRTSTRLLGAAAVAVALLGAGSTTAFAGGHDDPAVSSESGDGGAGGSGGIGVNVLCGLGVLGSGSCSASDGGDGGGSGAETGIGNTEG
ncbi:MULTISPECIES: hypothetical protein [unclassified Saccharopolyspora]|uniref:hypothetical protein n=1 Tax=unclassified Saccharopolyspora TaxID=2646250 RepID=UPI001CD2C1A5|nr:MULTISPECIES: hypothetical protein [unclassified Saccharopolyspora]MCA1188451.1 hypothetical protein [Saccharopolyspora sp. 6T]MCA1190775.1 hypothetical protein [Saccharopolyspora sp. 6V]MCA1226927.1 hypothetical protein [Saccharopolyspora sp. 6M]MCA1283346.1 hypothetical protein [Saccharopolyspora sp. 7B]